MKGWVKGIIAGVIILVIGVVILVIGFALNGWKLGIANFETETFRAEQPTTNICIQLRSGRIKTEFYDGENIKIEYPLTEKYQPEIYEENGKIIYNGPKRIWYMYLGWSNTKVPFTIIKIPKDAVYNLEIELMAGTVDIAQGEYGNIDIEVNAGAFSAAAITCDKFNCDVNAGAATVESLTCNIADCEVSAGACTLKKLNCPDITADVSAGALNITIDGVKSEYNITVDKSAGSCSVVSQSGTTDKKLEIDVSAGAVNVTFTD